eukprot:TRINITY_DN992_c0_g1_i1.p1 TRINITY_DN992_c0_g1~~TRINITY_DN992_c0_g1_i1.p1  ORF type:complete len:756 (+),score=245.17 TRINITY_DN992_c0_g1_i1:52-2268(+)
MTQSPKKLKQEADSQDGQQTFDNGVPTDFFGAESSPDLVHLEQSQEFAQTESRRVMSDKEETSGGEEVANCDKKETEAEEKERKFRERIQRMLAVRQENRERKKQAKVMREAKRRETQLLNKSKGKEAKRVKDEEEDEDEEEEENLTSQSEEVSEEEEGVEEEEDGEEDEEDGDEDEDEDEEEEEEDEEHQASDAEFGSDTDVEVSLDSVEPTEPLPEDDNTEVVSQFFDLESKDLEGEDESVNELRGQFADNEIVRVPFDSLLSEFTCPVCLGLFEKTMLVVNCFHRFCSECISRSLRVGKRECPSCRSKCTSHRSLRADLRTDFYVKYFSSVIPSKDDFSQSMIKQSALAARAATQRSKRARMREGNQSKKALPATAPVEKQTQSQDKAEPEQLPKKKRTRRTKLQMMQSRENIALMSAKRDQELAQALKKQAEDASSLHPKVLVPEGEGGHDAFGLNHGVKRTFAETEMEEQNGRVVTEKREEAGGLSNPYPRSRMAKELQELTQVSLTRFTPLEKKRRSVAPQTIEPMIRFQYTRHPYKTRQTRKSSLDSDLGISPPRRDVVTRSQGRDTSKLSSREGSAEPYTNGHSLKSVLVPLANTQKSESNNSAVYYFSHINSHQELFANGFNLKNVCLELKPHKNEKRFCSFTKKSISVPSSATVGSLTNFLTTHYGLSDPALFVISIQPGMQFTTPNYDAQSPLVPLSGTESLEDVETSVWKRPFDMVLFYSFVTTCL